MEKIPIVVIGGATASGKTALSIALAKRYGGRIISADSMQIYRRMDIGSAKPTMEERAGIRHELMDIAEPTENYSVADYVQAAHLAIADAHANNELPIVVGGTGLYINSLVDDIEFQEVAADPALRAALTKSAEQDGGAALYGELKRIDQEAAEKIRTLDEKYRSALAGVSHRELVVTHGAYGYLASAYGLSQLAIEGMQGTSDPSPAQMAKMIEEIKEKGIGCIFYEADGESKIAESIAKECSIMTAPLNPFEGDAKGRDYFSVMEENLEYLEQGLK